ncbi:LPXTG cell wall anchor domain-containing protein [Streptomyces aureoverticillatus]|uniref:LPXTG cell wall anchor domain-containing protein n=1 Tax=Streptomyces aureoverticillatus TaxID=66871 RepID=UPI0013D8EE5F|nr:LPXTG cell wall anchor domain-containing protein [Streptomyces aureoverticillatus]QIB47743.1 LPXTG cell wall anchor domain-containing protein [Streptomyces aureoverticillatus]
MGRPIPLARAAAGLAALACTLTAAPRAAADDTSDAPWPQSARDIRSVHRGGHVTPSASDGEAVDGKTKASSPAFARPVTLRGDKAVLEATATIRCDIKPGLYPVYLHSPMLKRGEVWGRLRVEPDGDTAPKGCRDQQQAAATSPSGSGEESNRALIIGGGAAGLAAAGAGGFFLAKRRRRRGAEAA